MFPHVVDATIPKIQAVNITPGFVVDRESPNADPSLDVTWSTVNDPDVRYVVRYSNSMGSLKVPPTASKQVTTSSSYENTTTILAPDKRKIYTYYFWVAAKIEGVPMGEYSDRASGTTVISELNVMSCYSVRSHSKECHSFSSWMSISVCYQHDNCA